MKLGWFLFSFDGRISRSAYWAFQLAAAVILVVAGIVNSLWPPSKVGSFPVVIVLLILVWPGLAVQAKRWHDHGFSATSM